VTRALAGLCVSFAVCAGIAAPSSRRPATAPAVNPSTRFSDLAEITPANVARLQPLWTFHLGEFPGGSPDPHHEVAGAETRPVLAGRLVIVTTTTSKVVAIDAETGAEAWRFDPFAGLARTCEQPNRGAAIWEGRPDAAGARPRLVFSGTCDGRLVAIDALTGKPTPGFADGGALDLKPGADARPGEEFAITSAPAIFEDLVIVGPLVPEDRPRGPSEIGRASCRERV